MALKLHELRSRPGSRTRSFRIGRGNGSGRGTTAGRGTKGQRARTGGRKGLKLKGIKQMLLGVPKLRGFRSMYEKPATIRLETLERKFSDQEKITLEVLKQKGVMAKSGTQAKIVGLGPVSKKFTIEGLLVSASAQKAIEAAGGHVKTS